MWRSVDVWVEGTPLRRYRCAERLDRVGFVVVTMDFVRPDDSPERRAQQDGYFRGQLFDLGELEEAPSLLEAIRRHDEEFVDLVSDPQ